MYRLKILISLIIIGIIIGSCTKESDETKNIFTGESYFPLKTGNNIVYKITEIVIDKPSAVYDTTIYYLKEEIGEKYIDNQGDTAYYIERHIKFNPEEIWELQNIWTSKNIWNTALKTEENIKYVKIRFPAKKGFSWDGNIFNNLNEKEYEITDINQRKMINEIVFDSCMTVTHLNSSSLIHKELEQEIYAINIGLVYKEITNINSQEVILDTPIEQRVTTADIYTAEIVSYQIIE